MRPHTFAVTLTHTYVLCGGNADVLEGAAEMLRVKL
jgi:hypothetical protein